MKYREQERERALSIRDQIFHDPGQGVFQNKECDFALADPKLNLWEGDSLRSDGIREEELYHLVAGE